MKAWVKACHYAAWAFTYPRKFKNSCMATFSLKQPLSLTVALMCMAMAANVSAAPTQRSDQEGEASMMKKLQGDRRNIDLAFAAEKLRFYILSKGQTPPSGPSKRHNRRLGFTGGETSFHVLAKQRTVPPSHDPSQRDYSTPSELTRGALIFQVLPKGHTVPPSGPSKKHNTAPNLQRNLLWETSHYDHSS